MRDNSVKNNSPKEVGIWIRVSSEDQAKGESPREAKNLNHTYVGTEHLLLGLLLEGHGVACRALRQLNVNPEQTRLEILKELDPNFVPPPSPKNLKSSHPAILAEPIPYQSHPTFEPSDSKIAFKFGMFTPRAEKVLMYANQEAERLNHDVLGTGHLLLGLIKLGQGVAVNTLYKQGLDPATVRMEVEKLTPCGPDRKMIGNILYSPRVKHVLDLAQKEAKNLNHTYVGTEHLLLGLLREGDGVACKALHRLNVNTDYTRLEILKELTPTFIARSNPENLEPVRHATLAEPKRNQSIPTLEPPDSHKNQFQLGPFTPHAEQVFLYAHQEAEILNHNFLGTEHVLLGVIKLNQGVAVNVLKQLGLDLEAIRMEIKKQVPIGPHQLMAANAPYTPRVKRVIILAQEEAKRLGHTYVGTEHLLLGLLLEGDGVAGRVLHALNVNIEQTRLQILKHLDPNFSP